MDDAITSAQQVVSKVEPSSPEPRWNPKTGFGRFLDRYFHIGERGSSILKELLGGLVIFLAMFYILPLNASMLSTSWANAGTVTIAHGNIRQTAEGAIQILLYGDTWADAMAVYAAVFAATAISAAVTTIAMGLYGKLPIGLASGLGSNSLIAYTVMLNMGYNFAQSLCLVLIDGILFLIISLTPLRAWIIRSIPKSLKFAISSGLGFFICFIGFQNMGIIRNSDATLVALGDMTSPTVLVGLFGVILVLALASLPQKRKAFFWISKFAVIISMIIMGILCGSLGSAGVPGFSPFYHSDYSIANLSNFGLIFGACFHGFDVFANPMAFALVFALLFVDFFDTAGTLVGVETGAGMIDKEGNLLVDDKPAMVCDAGGTVFGAVCGTTTVTSFVESTAGVAAGARTGLAAVTTGLLFGLSLLIFPALSMFSSSAVTGLALIYVGVCMFRNLENIDWHDWVAVASSFVTIIIMTLAYSISDGIAWGFISYTFMTLVTGKFKRSDITVAICSLAFIVIYAVKYLTHLA